MNEFIVWDKIEKEFVEDLDLLVDTNGDLFCYPSYHIGLKPLPKSDYTYHKFIMEDKFGNKVYANSSIVEFTYNFKRKGVRRRFRKI